MLYFPAGWHVQQHRTEPLSVRALEEHSTTEVRGIASKEKRGRLKAGRSLNSAKYLSTVVDSMRQFTVVCHPQARFLSAVDHSSWPIYAEY